MKNFQKTSNMIRLAIIWPNWLDNLTFYLIETMLKPTETSEKVKFFWEKNAKISSVWKKLQKLQVFGKNCKNFKFLEKKLQKSHNFG